MLLAVGWISSIHSAPYDYYGELPVHPGVGGFFKGPNSETIVKGPDGSVITAAAEGGEVQTKVDLKPIVVAEAAPAPAAAVVAQPLPAVPLAPAVVETTKIVSTAVAAPIVTSVVEPIVTKVDIVPEEPHIIETELVDAPDVEPDQASDLIGPSGRISTKGSKSIVSGPASTTISG